MDSLADDEIVAQVRAGHTRAFEILMRRYNQRLFRAARAILRDDAEAEDALQETYFRAFSHLSGFRQEAALGTWLTKIAVHEAFARLRRRREVSPLDSTLPSMLVSPEQRYGNDELRRALELAIDALPERLRVVFVLRAVEDLDTAATAQVLGISLASVKVRLHRARAALRSSLSDRVDAVTGQAFTFLGERCDRLVATVLGVLARGMERRELSAESSWRQR